MYYIAICDDNSIYDDYIERIFKKVAAESDYEIIFYKFLSGRDFIYNLDKLPGCDLLILDMVLGDMTGDEVAGIFRKSYPDSILVFCSCEMQPTSELFYYNPFRFFEKSTNSKLIESEVISVLNEIKRIQCSSYILGHFRSTLIKLNLDEILYFENIKRGSRIAVCPNHIPPDMVKKLIIDYKVTELAKLYPQFVFIRYSCIVNLLHIRTVSKNTLTLDSGEKLPVSKKYAKELVSDFTQSLINK